MVHALHAATVASIADLKKNPMGTVADGEGFRSVYEVRHQDLIVLVVAVGKRERNEVCRIAARRSVE